MADTSGEDALRKIMGLTQTVAVQSAVLMVLLRAPGALDHVSAEEAAIIHDLLAQPKPRHADHRTWEAFELLAKAVQVHLPPRR